MGGVRTRDLGGGGASGGAIVSTIDLDATEPTIQWPACVDDAPAGFRWGRHVSLGACGEAYYLIRESDGAAVIAVQRPDLDGSDLDETNERLDEMLGAVAYGYTFSSWLRAAGRQDSASEYDLRAAWRSGEDPSEYMPDAGVDLE